MIDKETMKAGRKKSKIPGFLASWIPYREM
jgi:hypothetical protein